VGFPLYIAKRYIFSKSSTNAVNIIAYISIFLIVIVTAVLVVVVSGFSGIKDFNLSLTSITDPDLKISPLRGKTFTFNADQEKELKAIERAYLQFKGKKHLGYIKGIDENYTKVVRLDTTVSYGLWPSLSEPEFAIGEGVARTLSIGIGDYRNLLTIMVPKPGTGQITDLSQAFSSSQAVVSGIFRASESIDNDHLFGSIDFVGRLLKYDSDTVSTLAIKLDPTANEAAVRSKISESYKGEILIKNRIELNDALHKMLNTENLMLYFVCALILVIALFSFVGSMIMNILDKKKNIKTLSDIGATIQEIRLTFFLQGALIILVGGIVGILLGLLVSWLQEQFQMVMITPTLSWPMRVDIWNVLLIFVLILGLGFTAARLAASKITHKLIADS